MKLSLKGIFWTLLWSALIIGFLKAMGAAFPRLKEIPVLGAAF